MGVRGGGGGENSGVGGLNRFTFSQVHISGSAAARWEFIWHAEASVALGFPSTVVSVCARRHTHSYTCARVSSLTCCCHLGVQAARLFNQVYEKKKKRKADERHFKNFCSSVYENTITIFYLFFGSLNCASGARRRGRRAIFEGGECKGGRQGRLG